MTGQWQYYSMKYHCWVDVVHTYPEWYATEVLKKSLHYLIRNTYKF